MTSETARRYREAFVWVWLPEQDQPVVAGRLSVSNSQRLVFNYGQRYLARTDSLPLYLPELPLQPGILPLLPGLSMPGCLRDASPDAWGRRVIMNRLTNQNSRQMDTGVLDELTYLLESGSDRIGALDFQCSATEYVPRHAAPASLETLMDSASRIEQGLPLPAELAQALQHGTSIGGARPKALIADATHQWIAKFSSSTDLFSYVKAEFLAMRLAALSGLRVASVQLVRAGGKEVLLVERFDRQYQGNNRWQRRMLVSALTLLGLDEMLAAYASYADLADIIRQRFSEPRTTLKELFNRLVFNILCGNTDDHARNHAAFWDGQQLQLTPAYDLCPQVRTGQEATQAMLIHGQTRFSQLSVVMDAAAQFLLTKNEARQLIEAQLDSLHRNWDRVCDEAALSASERNFFWQRQFLNPFALQGF